MARTWEWELLAGPATITEGPVWDGSGLFYTGIDVNEIRRYDPATGDVMTVYRDTGASNDLAFGPEGALYACEGKGSASRPLRAEWCKDDAGRPLCRPPSQWPPNDTGAQSRWSHLVHRPSLW